MVTLKDIILNSILLVMIVSLAIFHHPNQIATSQK